MAQNYRVAGVRWFGAYKEGSILPEWAVARAGPVAELVARGVVVPTTEPVNVDIRVPEPKVATDPTPAMADELNRLRTENDRLAADNKGLTDRVAALREQVAARDRSLGEQTDAIKHLEEAAEAHQAKIAELEAVLESATAPAGAT